MNLKSIFFFLAFSVRTVPKLSISYLFMHGTRYYSLCPDLNKTVVLDLLLDNSASRQLFCYENTVSWLISMADTIKRTWCINTFLWPICHTKCVPTTEFGVPSLLDCMNSATFIVGATILKLLVYLLLATAPNHLSNNRFLFLFC